MPEDPHTSRSGGTWSVPPEHLRLALRQPVLAPLAGLGVVSVTGADAQPFLNGQLTIDVAGLDGKRWQLGAYCSPKGRVVALFEMWRDEAEYALLMPAELTETLRTRLSRYVLRSKVRLTDVSASWAIFGMTGPRIEQALQTAGLSCPDQPWSSAVQEGARLARVPASPRSGSRFLLLTPVDASESWQRKLSHVAQVDAGVWWWSKIDAGLPEVYGATQERFVPQVLNLDVLGGVHFSKGCYPGQEVVARSQYLGKLRRRMVRGHAASARAGDDVFAGTEAVGTVVAAATSPDEGMDLLLECPSELAHSSQLRIGSEQSGGVRLEELPYPMINPTA